MGASRCELRNLLIFFSEGFLRRNKVLSARGAEAAFTPAVSPRFQELHLGKDGVGDPHEDELRDSRPRFDLEGGLPVVVYEGNPDLPPIPRVYEPRRIPPTRSRASRPSRCGATPAPRTLRE